MVPVTDRLVGTEEDGGVLLTVVARDCPLQPPLALGIEMTSVSNLHPRCPTPAETSAKCHQAL